MARRRLSKSDVKELNQQLSSFSIELSKRDAVEVLESEQGRFYIVNGRPYFFELEGRLLPHLKLLQEQELLPKVTVDMGAVKFVTNGADTMRPGITKIDPGIAIGDFVVIVDEQHGKALAVGEALLPSAEMEAASSGKMVKAIHYVGDKIWSLPI